MPGLGESLTNVGNAFMQHGLSIHKDEMLNKLEQDKEKRAEERTKRQEERAKQNYKETKTFQTADGSWMEQDYNAAGEPMSDRPPRPASPDRVQSLTNQQQAEKISLENAVLGNKKSQFEVDNMADDKALDRRYKESQITENTNQGLADLIRARNSGSTGSSTTDTQDASPGALTNMLIKEFPDLKSQYTEGDDPVMTNQEFRDIAQQVIILAGKRGVDPRIAFSEALKRYKKPSN